MASALPARRPVVLVSGNDQPSRSIRSTGGSFCPDRDPLRPRPADLLLVIPSHTVMHPPSRRCERAMAYLKARVDEDDPTPTVALDHDNSPVLRDLGNGLLVSYVVDQGDHFDFINHRQIAADGVSTEWLHRTGLANLAAAVSEQGVQVHPYQAIFAVIAGGNLEASLLLLDDVWDRAFRQFVNGTCAVA